jgi:Protein of unknown function (DUF1592)/Protein of unknown function (DUF1588)/Protein of unknown function (DUF1595)/Protein of unknown function (DUF1587)
MLQTPVVSPPVVDPVVVMPPVVLPTPDEPCTNIDITLRRLSNGELNKTFTALTGTARSFGNELAQTTAGGVFDNNRRAQSLSVSMVAAYMQQVVEPLVDELLLKEGTPNAQNRVLTCDFSAASCQTLTLQKFATRAWRRAVTQEEMSGLLALSNEAATLSEPPIEGLRWALVDILLSPHFWFRAESGASNSDKIDGFALASRLSFLLWGEGPDDGLLDKAQSGALQNATTYEQEVDRLLADSKAVEHWTASVAGQWFGVRSAAPPSLDANRFSAYANALDSMRGETNRFLAHVFQSKAPLTDLVVGSYTFPDAKLKSFYQFNGGADLQKTELPAGRAAGVLSHPLLLASSHGDANAIFRGAWVLKRLMCKELVVPKDVPGLVNTPSSSGLTVAGKLLAHRTNPSCASCHNSIDPIGLALDDLDAAAQPRPQYDDGNPLEEQTLPDGTNVKGFRKMAEYLRDSNSFAQCSAQRLAAYAYGVPLKTLSEQRLAPLVAAAKIPQVSVPSLLKTLAMDAQFKTVCGVQAQ